MAPGLVDPHIHIESSMMTACAYAEGALLNVEINLKSAGKSADRDDVETSLQRLRTSLGPLARRCQDAVHAALSA